MHKQLKLADRLRARAVVLVGDREHAVGTATVKDMATGEQRVVPQLELVHAVNECFTRNPP